MSAIARRLDEMMQRHDHGADHKERQGDGDGQFDGGELSRVRACRAQVGEAKAGSQHGEQHKAPQGEVAKCAKGKRRGQPAPTLSAYLLTLNMLVQTPRARPAARPQRPQTAFAQLILPDRGSALPEHAAVMIFP